MGPGYGVQWARRAGRASGGWATPIGYSAMGSVYAVAGIIAMLAIAVRWRDDLWPAHAPANAG